jgi:hypothetical protein
MPHQARRGFFFYVWHWVQETALGTVLGTVTIFRGFYCLPKTEETIGIYRVFVEPPRGTVAALLPTPDLRITGKHVHRRL